MTPTRGRLRLARASAFALTALTLSVVAHVASGGAAPTVPMLVGPGLLLTLGSIWLTAARRRLPVILAALAGCELALHETFAAAGCALTPLVSGVASGGRVLAGAHGASVALPGPGAASATLTTGMPALVSATHGTGTMLLAHALATLGLAWLLARGEHTLWQLTGWLCGRRPAPSTLSGIPATTGDLSASVVPRLPRLRVTAGAVSRRGPPRLASALVA